ncbi:MAG: hypothetical protein P8101_14305 [Candidatus Thiodiazotropha sp.]
MAGSGVALSRDLLQLYLIGDGIFYGLPTDDIIGQCGGYGFPVGPVEAFVIEFLGELGVGTADEGEVVTIGFVGPGRGVDPVQAPLAGSQFKSEPALIIGSHLFREVPIIEDAR